MSQVIDLKTQCNALRETIHRVADQVRNLKCHPAMEAAGTDVAPKADRAEMSANIMLAYRHLEDARMRLGKVIQAYEGGVSIYDSQTSANDPT